jgi:hypothetical protein
MPSASTRPAFKPVRSVIVPADTIVSVTLPETLSTRSTQPGQEVIATIAEPVYVGPYLVVPKQSLIRGIVVDSLRKPVKEGPNPYILVQFDALQKPGENRVLPFRATLLAYKTGLSKHDYVWRLPTRSDKRRERIGSTIEGAVVGTMISPIIGTAVGAGAGLAKSYLVDKVANRSAVKIKPNEELPIAVSEEFFLPVSSVYTSPKAVVSATSSNL